MGKAVIAQVVGIAIMAAAVVLAAPTGGLSLAVAGALGVSAAVASAIIITAVAITVSLGFQALGVGAPSARAQVGPPSIFRQAVTNSFIVYGKRRVGGLIVFFEGFQGSTGAHWRYFVIAVAGHRCKGVVSWMLNDEVATVNSSTGLVTSGKYANQAWLWFQRGLDTETPNATFVSECAGWTSSDVGNGVAAIYAKFKLNDALVQAGMPNITAVIEGKDDILDPRTATTGYTRNAILVAYDWLKIPREEGGFGAYDDEIPDDATISALANVCDETVNGAPRYALDCVITTGAPPSEIRDAMVVNMAGSYSYSGGVHYIRPGYWVPVSATLSEDDLSGPIQVSAFASSDTAANEVQGTYISPADNYQGAPFPTQTLAIPPTDIRQTDLDLAFTTNADQAARIARIMLNRAQADKTVIWPMNIVGLKYKALDNVQLASTRYGLDNYAFQIVNWGFSPEWDTVLTLREENAEIYSDGSAVTPATPPSLTVPTGPILTASETQALLRDSYPVFGGVAMSAAESGGIASVTIPNFTIQYAGGFGAIAVTGTTIGSLAPSTEYFPYIDVAGMGDASPTFGVATDYADALNSAAHPLRLYLNQSITTPASGSGGSSSGGGFGGGYGGGGAIP